MKTLPFFFSFSSRRNGINVRSWPLYFQLLCCGGFVLLLLQTTSAKKVSVVDPKVLFIPIHDSGEKMINMKKERGIALAPSPEIPNNHDYYYLRPTVYRKLIQAQNYLPKGFHFCIYEGYRSKELQKFLFDKRMRYLHRLHPDWNHKQLFLESARLVSPTRTLLGTPIIPAHNTGSTVDLYLIDDQGKPLPMGIHPKDWMTDEKGELSRRDSSLINHQERHNRRIMSHALNKVGMQNIDSEYWHWSYGDRYWAYKKHQPFALYGPTKRPHPYKH